MRTPRPLITLVAASAAATLVAGLTAAPASAATYDAKPNKSGSRWLAAQLTDGIVHNDQFDFDDYGLTIDVALALEGSGRKPKVVQKIATAFAPNVSSYTGYMGDVYAGSLGKAAVLALAAHRDPRDFGGQDLIAQLEARVSSSAPIVGRIEDLSSFGDFANVFGQAHAARALALSGSTRASDAVSFLLQQQCSAGFFRNAFTVDKAWPDQTCDGAPAAERKPNVDATALAVLSLDGVKAPKVKAAVRKAVAWLVDNQRGNGSFSSESKAKGASNANSTGLAGWALGESGKRGAAARAAVWVRNLQAGGANPCAGRLAKQVGAVALDQAGYADGQANGIKKVTRDQWRRTSVQAVPGLAWAPKAEGTLTASGPRTAKAGQKVRIELTGVAAGQRVCVKDGKRVHEFRSGRQARSHVAFRLGKDTGRRTIKVFVDSKRRDVVVRVTG